MNAPSPESNPVAKLEEHLKSQSQRDGFDMDDAPDKQALEAFPQFHSALRTIQELVVPVFQQKNQEAVEHQENHRNNVRIAAFMGAVAIVAACLQLGFGATAPVVATEVCAVLFCVGAIYLGWRTARQDQWLICRNVAERCRHLKFYALTRRELWCGNTGEWASWLKEQVADLQKVSDRSDLLQWVTDDPLPDPPGDIGSCLIADHEAVAVACYFRHKRVQYQRNFFDNRAKRFTSHKHRLHHIPSLFFWASIGAALLHFILELWVLLDANNKHPTIELWAHRLIVIAAAAPAIGAGMRTWLLAFEFGRSALLYQAQRSSLDKRLDALQHSPPGTIFTAIWFTEQALEEEHRAWIRLMLEAEWFG